MTDLRNMWLLVTSGLISPLMAVPLARMDQFMRQRTEKYSTTKIKEVGYRMSMDSLCKLAGGYIEIN